MSSTTVDATRILIVDDHAMFRDGLAELLNQTSDLVVVGRCASAGEALLLVEGTQPTMILLDFDLGVESAYEFVEMARAARSTASILILTAGVSETDAMQLVQLGVAGIVHKTNTPEMLCDLIRRVAAGEVCLEKAYLKPLFQTIDETRASQLPRLTERDKKILRMVFQGSGNKEIGSQLALPEGALKAALRQLFQKLGVRTRAQMVKVALEEYRDQLEV